MHGFLGTRCFGIKLHRVGFDAPNGPGVRGEQDVRNLRQHRVRQVLNHERHAVHFRPAE